MNQAVVDLRETVLTPEHTLTLNQRRFLNILVELTVEYQRPPTIRELGERLGMRSPNGVISYFCPLRDRGYIKGDFKTSRGRFQLTDRARQEYRLVQMTADGILVRLLAPEVVLSNNEVRALIRDLKKAINEAE